MSNISIKKKKVSKKKKYVRTRSNGEGCLYKPKGERFYQMRYFDVSGKRVELSTKSKDKSYATKVMAKHIRDRDDILNGFVSPTNHKVKQAGETDIKRHVDDYLYWCANDSVPIQSVRGLLQKKRNLVEWVRHSKLSSLSDCSMDKMRVFLNWRQNQRKGRQGNLATGARTWNIVLGHVLAFLNWCVDNDLLLVNPIKKKQLSKSEKQDPRRKRRAFTNDEETRLISVVRNLGRELWYRLALEVGLRKGDLQRLVWKNFEFLQNGSALLHIQEQKTKGRTDTLPIDSSLSKLLKKRFKEQGNNLNGRVFPQTVTDRTRDKDFVRASILKVDAKGCVVDLHACRKTLATKLVTTNAPIATIKHLMRHIDLKTTLEHYDDHNSELAIAAKSKALATLKKR